MSGKVLVSGANGFVAVWVVKRLLEKGYTVIGTVRSEAKGVYLKEKLFKEYADQNKLEIVVVDDITKTGAFDEFVKDVKYVAHTASPFHYNITEPDELLVPAVKGTKSILESITKYGTGVKHVVVTSSVAAINRVEPGKITLSEKDWNEQAVQKVHNKEAANPVVYQASKVLAERAAWESAKGAKWGLTVLNPPWVFGPPIHEVKSVDDLNTSNAVLYKLLCTADAGGKTTEELATTGSSWVDVRDLADAHVEALTNPKAAGTRIIISPGSASWQSFLDAANAVKDSSYPTLKGNEGSGNGLVLPVTLDNRKSVEVFGIKYRTVQDCVTSLIENFKERGW